MISGISPKAVDSVPTCHGTSVKWSRTRGEDYYTPTANASFYLVHFSNALLDILVASPFEAHQSGASKGAPHSGTSKRIRSPIKEHDNCLIQGSSNHIFEIIRFHLYLLIAQEQTLRHFYIVENGLYQHP
ncbi:hypothetical protein ONS95_015036 [Cadophora gregata]|uniref:uncharacterized protein n=1 Tax=Cadophora gregata TaxID=51156 RepID=UPI0026DA8A86|nr:uncharacterized protein ONS95_015036 [Cadophora gregata]KAK0103696.1 hypothetical protein ONS95_015036 [Cadophora gregata]KAK0107886.1 hypothetical protein ONS96_014937 [Cadophora gregata f. sp. sojae]